MNDFSLHPRLAADTHLISDLELCQLRLMNDSRFAWMILVPRRPDICEVYELSPQDQQRLWHEATFLGQELQRSLQGDKLNLATLGNQVAQLHLHVIVRSVSDPAWPAPVWGFGEAQPYEHEALEAMRKRIVTLVDRLA